MYTHALIYTLREKNRKNMRQKARHKENEVLNEYQGTISIKKKKITSPI